VHHRTHLIADSLGGYNIIENIVPLHAGRNLSEMESYENEVKRRTRAGERVYYFVRPVYGPRLPPIGLEVYIYSTRSRPIVGGWVPNAPPDSQSSLFNETGL
jgi:hypothetical protein